ncbi:MAG: TOBE domain-containing protein, partial [Candidatus Entotheonellia bacterium]
VFVCLRPEDITLCVDGHPSLRGGSNIFEGKVLKTMPAGPHIRVIVDCGVPIVALVTRPAFRNLNLSVGKRVLISFTSAVAHLIRRAVPLPPGLPPT